MSQLRETNLQLSISFKIHLGSGNTLLLPPISSSHDCYTQLLSGDASIISVERNEHANHQQTARCMLKHPKRERKKLHARTRSYKRQNEQVPEIYICVARERENCFISLLSTVKFYKGMIESALIAISSRISVIYIINYFGFKNNWKVN